MRGLIGQRVFWRGIGISSAVAESLIAFFYDLLKHERESELVSNGYCIRPFSRLYD